MDDPYLRRFSTLGKNLDWPVVIAVIVVWVVQPTIDEKVVLVAVWHNFVTTAGVFALALNGVALSRIGCVDGDKPINICSQL